MVSIERKVGNNYEWISCINYNASKMDFVEEILSLGEGEYRVNCVKNDEDFTGNWRVAEGIVEKIRSYVVQETIGGWKQNPIFEGSEKECIKFYKEWCTNGIFNIIPADECEVDYL